MHARGRDSARSTNAYPGYADRAMMRLVRDVTTLLRITTDGTIAKSLF
jgi:hypothetical protein